MKKKFLIKVVGVVLATLIVFSLCFVKFNKVDASAVNNYQDENYWFRDASAYNGINDINDLKGKTFTISTYDLVSLRSISGSYEMYINILERDYIGVEINEETHETIQCVDYLQYPYIIYESINANTGEPIFNIFSFYLESSDNYSMFYINDTPLNQNSKIQLQGSLVNQRINNFAYLPLNNIIERSNVPLVYCQFLANDAGVSYLNFSNFDFLTEENFLNNIPAYNVPSYQFLNFYFVFPNTNRYSLSWSVPSALFFFESFIYVQPYNANIEDKIAYGSGIRDKAYREGYNDGLRDAEESEYRFTFLTGIFNAVNDILAIEIFPNINLGYFILIPLALGVTGMIFWFWRKD